MVTVLTVCCIEESRGRLRGKAGIVGGTCVDSLPSTVHMRTVLTSGRTSCMNPEIGFADEDEEEGDTEEIMDGGCRGHFSIRDKSMRVFTGRQLRMIEP